MKQTQENSITEGVIWKQLLVFFFPIMIGSFFQQLYNTVDAVIVGQYVGKEALAGVGSTGTIINLLVGFFIGLASGASVIISQFFGARDERDLSKAVHTSVAMALAGGAILTAAGLLISRPALRWLAVPADVMDEALTYINIYFIGVTGSIVYNVGTGILRAIGDSKRPLYILIICCFVNIFLDLLFVVAFRWGVSGVALATVLSQAVSAVLIMARLTRTTDVYRVELRNIRFDAPSLKKIIRIGLPTGAQSVMYSASNLVIQAAINAFGTDVLAGWTAVGRIDGFVWMVMGAFGISITTFVGQNFGAAKYDRVKKGTAVCLGMTMAFAVTLTAVELIFAGPLLRIFTKDDAVVAMGIYFVRIWAPAYSLWVFIEIFSGAIRGVGESFQPMIITVFGVCGLRLAWIWGVLPFHHTPGMVAASYPVTWGATAVVFIIYYLRMNWLRRHIPADQAA